MLTRAVRRFSLVASALPAEVFSPLGWKQFRRAFEEDGPELPVESHALHFFNELLRREGIDKNGIFASTSLFEKLKRQYLPEEEGFPARLEGRRDP